MEQLAEAITHILETTDASVEERHDRMSVSSLTADDARQLAGIADGLGWNYFIFDSQQTTWDPQDLDAHYAPFLLNLVKAPQADGELLVLTNSGFSRFLQSDRTEASWIVACLSTAFSTERRVFCTPGQSITPPAHRDFKSPRELVREHDSERRVPSAISDWLLSPGFLRREFEDQTFLLWRDLALNACLRSLCNEFDNSSNRIVFYSPPRLSMGLDGLVEIRSSEKTKAFEIAQECVRWIYESDRETEAKHAIFTSEVSRLSFGCNEIERLVIQLFPEALASAKIAYQFSISEQTSDALRTFGELRKGVIEETTKIIDATRQMTTTVTAAATVGIGLIATRYASITDSFFAFWVMVCVYLYVILVTIFGWRFLAVQKTNRENWKKKIFNFLTDEEYVTLVKNPIKRSERTYKFTAILGNIIILFLFYLLFRSSIDWSSGDNSLFKPLFEDLKWLANKISETRSPTSH